jgi:serine/threonine-protein kinase
MIEQTRLDALLLRYEDSKCPGPALSPEELCRDCPELLDELRRQIHSLEAMNALLDWSGTEPTSELTSERSRPTSTAAQPGEALATGAQYRVIGLHARGGLGEVHRAWDENLGREVALKCMQPLHACNPASRGRFLREAEVTCRLEHPSIVPVHGVGQDAAGRPFYAMRFVGGQTLHEAIQRFHADNPPSRDPAARRLALRQLLGRLVAVCNTVAYAHSRGILHRDIKPGNILLGTYGETLLVDWGLAKVVGSGQWAVGSEEPGIRSQESGASEAAPALLPTAHCPLPTEEDQVIGTPAYMSPEQAAGRSDLLGPASDVYSLGTTLHTLLTGQSPFPTGEVADVLDRVQRGEVLSPRRSKRDVPRALDAICQKAMARQPEGRYASAFDLAADLEHWLADEPVLAWREPWTDRARRWLGRHRTWVAAAAAALLAVTASLAAATGMLTAANQREREARAQATHNFLLARAGVDQFLTRVSADVRLREQDLDDLRKSLLRTAAAFYDEFVQQHSDDPDVRVEQGRAYERLGAITQEVGSREDAIALHRHALGIFEELAHAQPGIAAYQRELAGSASSLGLLYAATGRPTEAEAAHKRALALRSELADQEPGQPEFQNDLAATQNNLGKLYNDTGRLPEAETAYRRAIDLRLRLTSALPGIADYEIGLADSCNNLGAWYYTKGRLVDSEVEIRRGLEIRERLAAGAPQVNDHQFKLAASYNNLGLLFADSKRSDQAEIAYRRALDIRERLARAHPTVSDYQSKLAGSHHHLGRVYADAGRRSEAEASYGRALEIQKRLAELYPTVTAFAVELGRTYCDLGSLHYQAGDRENALRWYAESLRTMSAVLRQEKQNAAARHCLSHAYQDRAEILTRLGRHTEALADWNAALAIGHGDSRERLRPGRAITLAHLGQHALATAEVQELTAKGPLSGAQAYAAARAWSVASISVSRDASLPQADRSRLADSYKARAIEMLGKANAAAHFKAPREALEIKSDPDLDPLRSRADFRKLLQEIESRGGTGTPR